MIALKKPDLAEKAALPTLSRICSLQIHTCKYTHTHIGTTNRYQAQSITRVLAAVSADLSRSADFQQQKEKSKKKNIKNLVYYMTLLRAFCFNETQRN